MGDRTLDARGWLCPLPVTEAARALAAMSAGERLVLTATDPLSMRDVRDWSAADAAVELERQETARDADGRELYVHHLRRRT